MRNRDVPGLPQVGHGRRYHRPFAVALLVVLVIPLVVLLLSLPLVVTRLHLHLFTVVLFIFRVILRHHIVSLLPPPSLRLPLQQRAP